MPINLSTNGIGKIMLGSSTEIVRVYLGTSIVYESAKPSEFIFEVDAGDTLTLQNDTRGAAVVTTNWGDGTTNSSLTHTYTSGGTYTVKTNYSVVSSTGQSDWDTVYSFRGVNNICKNITTLDYLFYNCINMQFDNINFGELDTSKFDKLVYTFHGVGSAN